MRISFNSSILPLLDTLVRLAADIGLGKDHSRRQIKKLRLKSYGRSTLDRSPKTNIEKKNKGAIDLFYEKETCS